MTKDNTELATRHTPTDGLAGELAKALPLLEDLKTGQDCQDYAFAKGKGFEAMTYCPEAFEALRHLPAAIAALSSRTYADGVEDAAKVAEMHDHRGDIAQAIRALKDKSNG